MTVKHFAQKTRSAADPVSLVLSLVLATCAAIYVVGLSRFFAEYQRLWDVGFIENAYDVVNGHVVVSPGYRDFAWLKAASWASLVGAIATIILCSVRSGAFRFPRHRLVLPFLFPLSFAMWVSDLAINLHLDALGQLAQGLLRFDEMASAAPSFAIWVVPMFLVLWVLSFQRARRSLSSDLQWLHRLNLLLTVVLSALYLVGPTLTALPSASHGPSLQMGLGSLILCLYCCVSLVISRATDHATSFQASDQSMLNSTP